MLGWLIPMGCPGLKKSRKQINSAICGLLDNTNTLAILKRCTRGENRKRARSVTTGVNNTLRLLGCPPDSSDEDVSEFKCAPPTRQTPTLPYTADPNTAIHKHEY